MGRSRERSFKNYLAGAALSFSVVLIMTQAVALYLGGLSEEEAMGLGDLAFIIMLIANFVGGALGSFLVARKVGEDHLQVGMVTAICGYILESIFFLFSGEGPSSDALIIVSLLIGGAIGSLFAKAWDEKRSLAEKKAVETTQTPGKSQGVEGQQTKEENTLFRTSKY